MDNNTQLSMENYLKIGDHSFYMIKTGEAVAINTERNSIKHLKTLPTAYIKEVEVITKEEFDWVKERIMKGL